MASHRRKKLQTMGGSGAAPGPDAPTTLLPIAATNSGVKTAPTVKVRAIFRRFWPETKGFRGRIVFSLLLVGVPPLLSAAGIWLFKVLVDNVLTPRNIALFPLVAGAFLAVTVVEGAVSFLDEYLTAWVGERFVLNLRTKVFGHLQRLSLTFFERHQLGDILARLSGDIGAIEQLILTGLNQTLTYLFQIIFFAGALFVLDWRLALAALVAAPFFLLLARFFSRRIKNASREQRRRSGSITAVAEESLHNTALVQAYHRQEHEAVRFHKENLGSFAAQMVAIKLEALFAPFTDLLQAAGVLGVVGFGIRELASGRITLGGLLVFVGYLSQLYGPISGLGGLANSIYAASAGAERVIEVLDTKPEVTDPEEPVTLGRARGEVRVTKVTYRYPDSGRAALSDVSFVARPGETVAVVGASGAGKSTLLRTLLRLHDPHSGSVTLDGVDLRDLRLGELRANIAVVLQETLVFDGSVLENIRWGRPDASLEDVVAAARAADAHQFITAMPQGYQTRIGQRGMMLSGGQRQRIALARAIIRNAPVLLLDEPTTGLDAASTQRVMEPLRRAMSGRTTIVISHNLLTVTDADRIVYLERGRVAGYGTHQELLASAPGYAELYRLHHPDQEQVPAEMAVSGGQVPRPRAVPAADVRQRPAVAAQRPTGAQQRPAAHQPRVTGAQPRPAAARRPTGAQPGPAAQPRPTRAAPRPTGAHPGPARQPRVTGAQPPPMDAQPQPALAHQATASARQRPTGAHPQPTGASQPPTGARPRPFGAPPQPATAGPWPEPTAVQPRLTEKEPRPGARPRPTSPPLPRPAPTGQPPSTPARARPIPPARPTSPPRPRPTSPPLRQPARSTSAPIAAQGPQVRHSTEIPAPSAKPRPAETPAPSPAVTPTPLPSAGTPVPTPVAATSRIFPVGSPATKPEGRPVPKPAGRPGSAPRPVPAGRITPVPLPIPRPRPVPSGVYPVPRWSDSEPFGTDEAAG